jgi:hypothetical protein
MHSGCETPRNPDSRGWLNFIFNTLTGVLVVTGIAAVLLVGALCVQFLGTHPNTRWLLLIVPAIPIFYALGVMVRRDF